MKVSPEMVEAAWQILTRYKKPNTPTRNPRSIGVREVRRAIEAALTAGPTTYTEICRNSKCPRGGKPVEIVSI